MRKERKGRWLATVGRRERNECVGILKISYENCSWSMADVPMNGRWTGNVVYEPGIQIAFPREWQCRPGIGSLPAPWSRWEGRMVDSRYPTLRILCSACEISFRPWNSDRSLPGLLNQSHSSSTLGGKMLRRTVAGADIIKAMNSYCRRKEKVTDIGCLRRPGLSVAEHNSPRPSIQRAVVARIVVAEDPIRRDDTLVSHE